jgi:hypothetical protein
MSPPPPPEVRAVLPDVAIVGTDAVLAAAPATAVQIAHACLARGFEVAIPGSWGDELVAAETVRRLAKRERGPAVACSCPFVRARLQTGGADLGPFLLSLAPPPVALARYLRALYGARGVRITYIGACPAGADASIDEHLAPMEFFAQLAQRGISLVDQPRVFDSVVPPDRRRWCSLPGGAPAPELLWSEGGARTLVELEGQDVSSEIAEQLIANARALVDLAPALGCACAGAVAGTSVRDARPSVITLEPPRALGPVIDPGVPVSFEPPAGAGPPLPGDRAWGAGGTAPASPPPDSRSALPREAARSNYWHTPSAPQRAIPPADATPLPPSVPMLGLLDEETLSSAALFRPDASRRRPVRRPGAAHLPRARSEEGRTLPRAYIGRRRTPRDSRVIPAEAAGGERELRLHASMEPEVTASAGMTEDAAADLASGASVDVRSDGAIPASAAESAAAVDAGPSDAPDAPDAPGAGAQVLESAAPVSRAPYLAASSTVIPEEADAPAPPAGNASAREQVMPRHRDASTAGRRRAPSHVPEQDSVLRTLLFVATIVATVALAVFVLLSL